MPQPGDMRINNLLNDDHGPLESLPSVPPLKKGPGRGNWRRNRKPAADGIPLAARGSDAYRHALLPINGQINFVSDGPTAPSTPGGLAHLSPQHGASFHHQGSARDQVPTPSYQAQKRSRGVTQHQSALQSHRKQQIDYMLDKRIRKVQARAREERENEGAFLRAWKRIRMMPPDYDSEEEAIKIRKLSAKGDGGDEWRIKGKDVADLGPEELEVMKRPRMLIAGVAMPLGVDAGDIGEEAKMLARTMRRTSRRLERWQDTELPGQGMIRRRCRKQEEGDGLARPKSVQRTRSGTGRQGVAKGGGMEDDGGGDLDEEEREMLGDVDVGDESEEDEDEEMGDDS